MVAGPLSDPEANETQDNPGASEPPPRFVLLPLDEQPVKGEIIWCKWPGTTFASDDEVYFRPVLVMDDWTETGEDGTRYGVLRVSYGTGLNSRTQSAHDIEFVRWSEVQKCGLKKLTKFIMRDPYVEELIWSSEFFMPQIHITNGEIYIGSVSDQRLSEIDAQLQRRGKFID